MKRISVVTVLILLLLASLYGEKKGGIKLQEKYRKWLEEVVYIITPKEKDVFLQLATDKEREIFIEAFWKQRDPTPGTPRNEFQEEHYQRLSYANEFFGRGTPRPGWKTDQGRVYIVLGPPKNIETYDHVMNVYPTQIWFYFGEPQYGLPPGFNIIFFKKEGTGEYVLYSPSDDGPQSLIADYMGSSKDVQGAYQQLSKLEPNLARQTLSLIPGESVSPGFISLASNTLLSNVFAYPQKKVTDKYAEAILKYKDIIEVEYTANYIDSDSLVRVIKDDSGFFLVHYSIEPKKLSVEYENGKYTAHFELNGRISDLKGNTVYQYGKDIPVSFTQDQIQDMKSKLFALQDMFPLVPGQYKFNILIKNTVSREFTSAEEDITVPQDILAFEMSPLILGYKMEMNLGASEEIAPFRVGKSQILCKSKNIFTPKDSLAVFFQLFGLNEEMKSQGLLRLGFWKGEEEVFSKTKKISEYQTGINFIEEQSLGNFAPGYYRIKVSVLDKDGKEQLFEAENFEISPAADLPWPLVIAKVMPASHLEEYLYISGVQLLNKGNIKEAGSFLEKAYQKNPGQLKIALGYGQVLFISEQYQKVKEILLPFINTPNETDGVLYFIGKACHALGQYGEATSYYEKYLSRFGTNIEVLNLMGSCQYKLGNKKEALQIWENSLKINPDQEEIKKLVKSLQEKEK